METEILKSRLDELVTKKKLNKSFISEAVQHLFGLSEAPSGEVDVAKYLCALDQAVCQDFFEQAAKSLSDSRIESICTALRENEEYRKNAGYKGTARGFLAAATLIRTQNPFGMVVLMNTVRDAENKGSLSDKALSLFYDKVIQPCSVPSLNHLSEHRLDQVQQEKLRKIIEQSQQHSVKRGSNAVKSRQAESVEMAEVWQNLSPPSDLNPMMQVDQKVKTILDTVHQVHDELNILLRTIVNTNETSEASVMRKQIEELKEQLKERETGMEQRCTQLDDNRISSLQANILEREKAIADRDAAIEDLKKRLSATLALDASANNQELITLRTDIANALESDYQYYQKSKGMVCTPDQYEAFSGSLNRIFRSLKRLGIHFERGEI